jgi:hypothetical protein
MKPDPSKLRQQQEQAEQSAESQFRQQEQTARQFDSVEELIRFDTANTPPPETLAERLKESIEAEPKPARSWWQRLFGKGG